VDPPGGTAESCSIDRFKVWNGPDDIQEMHQGTEGLGWTRVGRTAQPTPSDPGQVLATDEQLVVERQRHRRQLGLLTMNPGTSPAIGPVFDSIERAIEHIDDELIRRVLSRNPWSPAQSTDSAR
jgi:hypothetical protein